MRIALTLVAALIAALALTAFAAEEAPAPAAKKAPVIGVFDSRAIAIVYAASEHQETYLKGLKVRLEAAKVAKDVKEVERISAEAKRRQLEFHLMAFSADSVKELLEPVAAGLPAVAKAAGVDVIVSKWEIVHRAADLKTVDVTTALVKLYDPDEKSLKILKDLEGREPLPREAVLRHQEK
ncbi:MAG: hypothetical protein ABFS86_09005 [Planctomycetota bacterium]